MIVATVNGETFTANEIMEHTGCSRQPAYNRIKRFNSGKITEDQLFADVRAIGGKLAKKCKRFDVGGKKYTIKDVMELTGVGYSTAVSRLRRYGKGRLTAVDVLFVGKKQSHALTLRVFRSGNIQYTVNDVMARVDISDNAARERLKSWEEGNLNTDQLFLPVALKNSNPTMEWLNLGDKPRNEHLLNKPTGTHDEKYIGMYDRNCCQI